MKCEVRGMNFQTPGPFERFLGKISNALTIYDKILGTKHSVNFKKSNTLSLSLYSC